jgi:hypothetical protein
MLVATLKGEKKTFSKCPSAECMRIQNERSGIVSECREVAYIGEGKMVFKITVGEEGNTGLASVRHQK